MRTFSSSSIVRVFIACVVVAVLAGCESAPDATTSPGPPNTPAVATASIPTLARTPSTPSAGQAITPSPTTTPQPPQPPQQPQQTIRIDSPQSGATLGNPFDLSGQVALTPPDMQLIYTLSDINGGVIASGTLQVNGAIGQLGVFTESVTLPPTQAGPVVVRVIAVDASVSVAAILPIVIAQPKEGIRLSLNGIASKVSADGVQGYINKRSYVDLDALPEHLLVLFDDDAAPKTFDPRLRQVLIIPMDEYRQLFGGEFATQFSGALEQLQAIAISRTMPVDSALTVLPANDLTFPFKALPRVVQFASGSGMRFVTQFTQEIAPVTSSNLTYVLQGLTSDGAFFVAGFFPITSSALAADAAQVTKEERDQLKKDYSGYIANTIAKLDQNPRSFAPTLAALDAMFESLTISANPLARKTPTPAPISAVVTTAKGRATEQLNIRSAASTRGRVLGQLQPNEEVELIGRNANTQWVRVRTAVGLEGWVSRRYIETSADLARLPVAN